MKSHPDKLILMLHEMLHLYKRMLTFPMPTLAVVTGHAIAGGLFWALCHDFRVMKDKSGIVWLSEINIGFPIPEGFAAITKHLLPSNVSRELILGGKFSAQ